jgi:hypothetical protein
MVTPDEFWTLTIHKLEITPSRQRKLDSLNRHLKESWGFTSDPIEFIQTHYDWNKDLWIDEKELSELWNFLKDKWMTYATADWLHKFLVVLWIKFRPNTHQTVKGKEKLKLNTWNKEAMALNLKIFNDALNQVMWEWHELIWSLFNIEHYEKLKHKIDKVVYLLNLNKEDISAISNISQLKWQAIMTAINTRLNEITKTLRINGIQINDIQISKWSINSLLKKIMS